MRPRSKPLAPPVFACLAFLLLLICGVAPARAQQVQVTATNPTSAAQGTVNLDVKVTGKGFKNGARARFFVTATADTGGVTVNSTTFVSSTELTANITVSDTAVIANFDVQVLNADGRGGKGTELFRVTAKGGGQAACPAIQPAPASDTKCYDFMPGCLDSTFSGTGYVHINPYGGSYSVNPNAVAVQGDGRIVVAGTAKVSSTSSDFAVIRYNPDGTLDTSFGDPDPLNPSLRLGYTVTWFTTGSDIPYALVLQPGDGKIVVSGWGGESVVVRYTSDGTLDPSFGSGGIARLGGGAPARDVTLQSDGKIVVGGAAGGAFSLVRLNTNGSLDSSFGSGGQVNVNPSGSKRGTGVGWGLAVQRIPAGTGEERIILAGWSHLSSSDNSTWTLMRFRSNGATDTSFGSGGIVKTGFLGFGDAARKVAIDASNRIVVVGNTNSASTSCGDYVGDIAVVRYTQDGALDGSFGGGRQIVDVYGGRDHPYGLALQADGKVLISGHGRSADNAETHFALVRLNASGDRDSAFGLLGNGLVTTDLYGTESWAFALALDPADGRIVVAGAAYVTPPSSQGDIVVARYWP